MSGVSNGGVVRVGQWWRDNDKRSYGRTVEVLRINQGYAFVKSIHGGGRETRIRLNRFRPNSTGYVLVQDVEAESGT